MSTGNDRVDRELLECRIDDILYMCVMLLTSTLKDAMPQTSGLPDEMDLVVGGKVERAKAMVLRTLSPRCKAISDIRDMLLDLHRGQADEEGDWQQKLIDAQMQYSIEVWNRVTKHDYDFDQEDLT